MNRITWWIADVWGGIHYYIIEPLRRILTKEGREDERRYQFFLRQARECHSPHCPVHSEEQKMYEVWENEGGKHE
jgi:hypothetical protein